MFASTQDISCVPVAEIYPFFRMKNPIRRNRRIAHI